MEDEEDAYREYRHKKKLPKKGPIPLKKKGRSKRPASTIST